ncbi:MAG: phage scaffolding protein [Ruminococcus sp.]|nr:phage scaffolding protein [Ruminococcus sp.]MCM1380329.1 phage scaffolding protein [Muribaculaceae bacterium]MCM1478241.1 phage scaffolding protein [Muribaculaceae bacterium]
MADFESIIKNHCSEDGSIPAEAIAKLTKAISTTVGNEFVEKTRYKAKLEEIDTLKTDKQTAEDSATTAEKWKNKYETLKSEIEAKETKSAKETAYRALLKSAGISEKRLESVLKVSDLDGVELDKDGKIKNADKLTETVKTEWADFIVKETETGANTPNPPANNGGTFEAMSLAEKMEFANANPNSEEVVNWLKN